MRKEQWNGVVRGSGSVTPVSISMRVETTIQWKQDYQDENMIKGAQDCPLPWDSWYQVSRSKRVHELERRGRRDGRRSKVHIVGIICFVCVCVGQKRPFIPPSIPSESGKEQPPMTRVMIGREESLPLPIVMWKI